MFENHFKRSLQALSLQAPSWSELEIPDMLEIAYDSNMTIEIRLKWNLIPLLV